MYIVLIQPIAKPIHLWTLSFFWVNPSTMVDVSLTQRIVEPISFYGPYNCHSLDESIHYVGLVFFTQRIVKPIHFMDLIIIIPWMNGL